MGFNSTFKGLKNKLLFYFVYFENNAGHEQAL